MKSIILTGCFILIFTGFIFAADSTNLPVTNDQIVVIEKDDGQEFDFFVDKDGDGICDNRTLRNKGMISHNQKIRHYRMISYKYNQQNQCEFGLENGERRGNNGNGQHGTQGHNGGQ